VPGVVFPVEGFARTRVPNAPIAPAKYFLTFIGSPRRAYGGNSRIPLAPRFDLMQALAVAVSGQRVDGEPNGTLCSPTNNSTLCKTSSETVRDVLKANRVEIRFNPSKQMKTINETDRSNFADLLSTDFGLVLRGHMRWSYRFTETICACAIPVILVDGWPLPFDHIIDWSEAAIVLPESLALDPFELVRRLPTDNEVIARMRARVRALRSVLRHVRYVLRHDAPRCTEDRRGPPTERVG